MDLQEAAEIVIRLSRAWDGAMPGCLSDTEEEAIERVKTHFTSIAKVEEEMERMDAILGIRRGYGKEKE